MKEIPIPECNNNRRSSMKCRRMCCRKPKPKVVDNTRQMSFWTLQAQRRFDHHHCEPPEE